MMNTKNILYPRPAYTQAIIQWADGEWDLMVKSSREETMDAVRVTIERLVLPLACERMRREILSPGGGGPGGARPGGEPSKKLLGILLGNLRYHGYIHRDGDGWTQSPLTPRQTHLVRLMSEGASLKRAATLLGVTHSTTRRICQAAMENTGTHTSAGLVGTVLYNGWMPGRNERRNLEKNLDPYLGPGYVTR